MPKNFRQDEPNKRDLGDFGERLRPTRRLDLEIGRIRPYVAYIDRWPNEMGRFASSLTGAHVSETSPESTNRNNGGETSYARFHVHTLK
ncbi:MAG: hypothetical protein P8Y53_12315 [Pseudolabrys sp.]|jgi:hypothetical protein